MENPYLLLTPGPITTTRTVKEAMQRDWCTWDEDYNSLIQKLRKDLVSLAVSNDAALKEHTAILMQGSGTFAVESVIGSVIPKNGKILVLENGAYGRRILQMTKVLGIASSKLSAKETESFSLDELREHLERDSAITHVAVVHCETTTGIMNDIKGIGEIVKKLGKIYIVDAMSSFGGVPFYVDEIGVDFMISSANKCVQGVPGFGFIIARRDSLEECAGLARSLALDLYDQWKTMEDHSGKWRFTSPTHVVRAFIEAMKELEEEGGIAARYQRYKTNHDKLVAGMESLGFKALLSAEIQSPVITSFLYPDSQGFSFKDFYEFIKAEGYVLYPGKISDVETFRIGNIGEVFENDIEGLLKAVGKHSRFLNFA
ncbi:MAG: 2-aminoethylphosphonate--pyruvate transaminase [Synergistaceae bacterium]|nr:2-aminoethylphosphonate--pyruvate transaminase [Synergistaceae bacterium]